MPRREFSLPLLMLMLLLISTIVLADPNLDLPDEFNELNVDAIFDRGDKFREPGTEEENKWRAKDEESLELDTNVRWGAASIYEDSDDPDPFDTNNDDEEKNKLLRSPEATPQLEIRF